MKNLTKEISSTKRESTERSADAGSSSRHSSRASIMMRVPVCVARSGPTMSFSIREQRVSFPTSGSPLRSGLPEARPVSKLEGESGEDGPKVAPAVGIS